MSEIRFKIPDPAESELDDATPESTGCIFHSLFVN